MAHTQSLASPAVLKERQETSSPMQTWKIKLSPYQEKQLRNFIKK